MIVTFTRTAERRYRVSVEGPGVVSSFMEPAPGYDARLPHDMAHFVVENELGIGGGVFGQLAAGGHAGTFRPTGDHRRGRDTRRGMRLAKAHHDDAMLSEKLVFIACQLWNNGQRGAMPGALPRGVTADDMLRVCRSLDAVSAAWSKLGVGESLTLTWRGAAAHAAARRRGRGDAGSAVAGATLLAGLLRQSKSSSRNDFRRL
jgi:hypothetical protein